MRLQACSPMQKENFLHKISCWSFLQEQWNAQLFPTPCLWEIKWILNAAIPFWLSFLSLSKPSLQQKAVGFCLLLQSAKSSSRWHLRGRNVKLPILYNDKQEKHYSSVSVWGRLALEKTQKKRRELLEEIMKGDFQRQGAKNLWITFFPFYNA